jgi:group I intron endonuclease
MKSGIYYIINTINNKCYIGSSCNLTCRQKSHWKLLRNNNHPNIHLQNAWNKYGEHVFKFEIVDEIDENDLLKIENEYLKIAKIFPFSFYNISYNSTSFHKGLKHSDDTKQLLRKLQFGKNKGSDNPFFGKRHSIYTKMKIGVASVGRRPSLDKKIYIFENVKTNERFKGTQSDFRTKYNFGKGGHVSSIINGKRKTYKKWKVIYS